MIPGALQLASAAIFLGLLSILTFGYADRMVGSDMPRQKSHGYGVVVAFAVTCAVFAYLTHVAAFWAAAGLALVWTAYRSPGWKIGGSMTPIGGLQKIGSFLRHSAPSLTVAVYAWLAQSSPLAPDIHPWAALPLVAFAVFAPRQSIDYGAVSQKISSEPYLKNINAILETDRGLAYGLAVAIAAFLA